LGIVCYFNPLLGYSVANVDDKDLPSATGVFHFVRAMVGGIGTSVFTTLWLRRTIFHHERISSYMTSYNSFATKATDTQSLALLNNALDQQAAILAINDAFFLMGWLFVGLVVLLIGYLIVKRHPQKPIKVNSLNGEL
jgi:DHA2 family multidrug resistance protein